jgi:flagellar motor switch protein FliM
MSAANPILSPEELGAILGEQLQGDLVRPSIEARPRPLARALAAFGDEQGRMSSTIHQRPIELQMLRCGSMPVGQFAASLLDEDRAFLLRLGTGAGAGAMVIGRSLLYGWLAMAFGAPTNLAVPVPINSYTRIESRFMTRLAEELVGQLRNSLGELAVAGCTLGEPVEPALLPERAAPRLIAASFEVRGIGEPGLLRIGFPDTWVDTVERSTDAPGGRDQINADRLLDMPLVLHAEVGAAELSLRRLTSLAPGDVIPIEGFPNGSVLVRIEDTPKFRAERGSAGPTAAIQIVSRI